MEFWIQKSKLKNNTKVGFHFQATTEWHFQGCLPSQPTALCWLCWALQDISSVWCGSWAGQGGPAARGQKEEGRWKRSPRLIAAALEGRTAGARGGNEKEMWDVPRDCSESCVFFFFQPVLLQVALFASFLPVSSSLSPSYLIIYTPGSSSLCPHCLSFTETLQR